MRCGLTTSAAVILPRVMCMPVDSKQRLTKTPFIRPRHADVPATSLIHDGISGHPSPAKYGTQLVGAPARCSIFFFILSTNRPPVPRQERRAARRCAPQDVQSKFRGALERFRGPLTMGPMMSRAPFAAGRCTRCPVLPVWDIRSRACRRLCHSLR